MTILTIVSNNLRLLLRRPIWFVFTVAMPLLFAFVIGIGLTTLGGQTNSALPLLLLIKTSDDPDSGLLLQQLRSSKLVQADWASSRVAAQLALSTHFADAVLALPSNYDQLTLNAPELPTGIALQFDPSTPHRQLIAREVDLAMRQTLAASRIAANVSTAPNTSVPSSHQVLTRLIQASVSSHVVAEATGAVAQGGFSQSAPGSAVHWAIFGALSTAGFIVDERRLGTIKRMMTMPIARSAIVIANMLLAFLVAFMQMLILICFGAVLGVNWGSSVLALGSVIASYALSMAGVSMLFASIARTRTQTLAMGLALSNLTSPLAGAWYPREMMPAILLDLGKLFPSGWAMQALRDVVLHQSTPASVTMHVVILLAFAAVFSWVGIKRFRYE